MQGRLYLFLAGLLGAAAVGLGAFQSHGLEAYLEPAQISQDAMQERLRMFDIGVRYQFYHALALAAVGALSLHYRSWLLTLSGLALFVGTVVFSGVLYHISTTGDHRFSFIAPYGGSSQIVGWVLLAVAALLMKARADDSPLASRTQRNV